MTDEHEIFAALEKGELENVISFLEDDPSLVNIVNEYGQTPFWLASSFGYTELVKIMLQMGEVDYRVRDHRGRDALDAAEAFHNKDIIEILNPIFGVGVYTASIEEEDSFIKLAILSIKKSFWKLLIFIFLIIAFASIEFSLISTDFIPEFSIKLKNNN